MFSRWQGIERNNMTRGCIRTNFKGKTALQPVVLCCYTSATPNSESYAGMIRQGLRLTLFKHLAQHQDWEGRIKDGRPIKLPCRLKGPFSIKVPLAAFVARKVWKLIRPPRNNLQKVRPWYSPNSKFLFLKESHRTGEPAEIPHACCGGYSHIKQVRNLWKAKRVAALGLKKRPSGTGRQPDTSQAFDRIGPEPWAVWTPPCQHFTKLMIRVCGMPIHLKNWFL